VRDKIFKVLGIIVITTGPLAYCYSEAAKPKPDIFAQLAQKSREEERRVAVSKQVSDVVNEGLRTGTIHSVDRGSATVQVNPLIWALWNADNKRAFAYVLKAYCGREEITIIDSQSGRELASIGVFSGFKVN